MSELATLARPYAAAVFKRAQEVKNAEKWSDSLAFISAVLSDEAIYDIVKNPKVDKARALELILDICKEQVHDEAENFLKLLADNDRLTLAPIIASLFEELKAEHEGYVDAEVVTAYPFSTDEEKKFSSKLEKLLKKKVHISKSVDKSLIGGFFVRVGDKVIDGSVKGQLQQLAKRL